MIHLPIGLHTWNTRELLSPLFATAWQQLLAGAPLAHFAYRMDYLQWEARHERHAQVVIAEHGGRRGAVVLRERRGEWVCGWPWRWSAVMEGDAPRGPVGLSPEDAEWMFLAAQRAAGRGRLRFYAPFAPPQGVRGHIAGATIMQAVDRSDEELLHGMGPSKRRMVRRAQRAGYTVREARTLDDFQGFHVLSVEAKRARGERPAETDSLPESGESWREWELPWMWLLLAERGQRVHSGIGDGVGPGQMVEGRTAASSNEARRDGAFALLCYEESRAARDRGGLWVNHGGDTVFKREVAGSMGERVPIWCWLGGGLAWQVPNAIESTLNNLRPMARALLRNGRGKRGP